MILTHKITLSLDRRGDRPCIDAVQGDTARAVEVSLLENGEAWLVPEGTAAVIHYRRIQSGTGGLYDTLPDGTAAYAMGESSVTVHLAQQVLAVAEPVELQVTLVKDGAELTCFTVLIHIQGKLTDAELDDQSYVNLSGHIRATVEDMKLAKREQTVHFIQGSTSSTSGKWIGSCSDITEYYEGLMVAFRTVVVGGSSGTTLNINSLGAVAVKRNGTSSDINYFYAANSVLFLVYVIVNGQGYWELADVWFSDTNNKTSAASSKGQKLYLVGAKAMAVSGVTTYANQDCFVGTDNCLYSGSKKVATVEDVPDQVPDYVRTEAQRLAKVVQSRQNENTVSFMLGSDIHAGLGLTGSIQTEQMLQSSFHAAQAMKILADQVHLDFVGLLGDYLYGEGETPEQAMEMYRMIKEYFSPAFRGLPQFWCKGDHDGLPDDTSVDQLTDGEVFCAVGIHNAGAFFDSEGKVQGYCYRDFEEYKLRVVAVNNAKNDSLGVDQQQLDWLHTVLEVQTGWKVIILSHCPLDWWGSGTEICQTVTEYESNILCNIHGHTHNYVTGMVGGTAVPRVAIPNIDFYQPNIYADDAAFGESVSYTKTAGSAQDTAFCVITIDLAAKKLYADRYGAGLDREVDLPADGT